MDSGKRPKTAVFGVFFAKKIMIPSADFFKFLPLDAVFDEELPRLSPETLRQKLVSVFAQT